MRKRWSVKEFYKLTDAEMDAKRLSTPRGQGITTGGSTVHKPHRTFAGAAQELKRLRRAPSFGSHTQFQIVDHDAEMRRWGRHDFIDYPTNEDRRQADAMRGSVIPSVAPGESVAVRISADASKGADRG